MFTYEHKCPICATPYDERDLYCRNCKYLFVSQRKTEEENLEGIKISDWHLFIDKNSSRYVDVFSNNRGKKIFFHMNWAAMLFSFYWMFYRKMYKYAFVFLAVSIIFTLSVNALAFSAVKMEVSEALEIMEPYRQYLTDNESLDYYSSSNEWDISKVLKASKEYNQSMVFIKSKLFFMTLFPTIVFKVGFGLIADCIYRTYILRNIKRVDGGTSGWSLVAGVIVYQIISNLVESPIATMIATEILY